MTATKNLGIWMDHASAHVMELTAAPIKSQLVESAFSHQVKEETISKSEHLMHNKEHHQHLAYYKKLGDIIKNYDHVLLFGPTDAKAELYNVLKDDHHFAKIQIDLAPADHMTEHQEHAFVKQHFAKN